MGISENGAVLGEQGKKGKVFNPFFSVQIRSILFRPVMVEVRKVGAEKSFERAEGAIKSVKSGKVRECALRSLSGSQDREVCSFTVALLPGVCKAFVRGP